MTAVVVVAVGYSPEFATTAVHVAWTVFAADPCLRPVVRIPATHCETCLVGGTEAAYHLEDDRIHLDTAVLGSVDLDWHTDCSNKGCSIRHEDHTATACRTSVMRMLDSDQESRLSMKQCANARKLQYPLPAVAGCPSCLKLCRTLWSILLTKIAKLVTQ